MFESISMEKISNMLVEYAPKVAGAILTLIIGFWIAGRIAAILRKKLTKRNIDPTIVPFLGSLVSITLKILVLLSAASMFGMQVTSFIAIFSAVAFAVGLALQGTLGHLASGVLLLIFKPYKVGDFIIAQNYSGTVKEIQLFNTILTTLDNRLIIIPNGAITNGAIENLTEPGIRRVDMTFGIGYGDDIDKAREVIKSVLKDCPGLMADRDQAILVKNLGDSSVDFAVRFWTTVEDYWPAFFHMQEAMKKAFDREGINIPFPQMDVHVKQN